MIDHVGNISPSNPRDIFAEQINHTYRTIKVAAQELNCAIVLLMQQKLSALERTNPRPIISDGYGGTATVSNLDVYFALSRPEKWLQHRHHAEPDNGKIASELARWENRAELINFKSRFGPEGSSRLVRFNKQFTRFEPLKEEVEPQDDLLGF